MYPIIDLVEHQTITTVQKEEELELAIKSQANIIFLLMGSIFNELVDKISPLSKYAAALLTPLNYSPSPYLKKTFIKTKRKRGIDSE
ncbi:hypothetical protein QFZ77_002173 [Paenibacillus sp. V4I3]|uniref:hypothetical protein n=1 Tax=unclassified Paenibacillus TaxID=185978 RepID=UPI00278448BC|nr:MULTISPECIES: hypothetical protein [unclassified Paenibacillus]MDQ0873514.1 hypothetical protein [Paenibacillus sp. V4I3]MDQ0890554.1 hypothetical protein [Paenibacillus sp. V4I9]